MTAMDDALAALAAIPKPHHPSWMKMRVREYLKCGPCHPGVWTRFERLIDGARHDRRHSLQTARLYVELELRAELKRRQIAIENWGICTRPLMYLNMLREARLVLRWLQRYQPEAYPWIRDTIMGQGMGP